MQTPFSPKPSYQAPNRNCSSPISRQVATSSIGRLGFVLVFTYGEPPFYGQVKRDAARINLRCVERPVIDPALRDREELLAAALAVATAEEIKALFLEFQAAGVAFFQTLKQQPWGVKNFIVKDPGGNLLLFAGSAE
jgi:hypothetical protein